VSVLLHEAHAQWRGKRGSGLVNSEIGRLVWNRRQLLKESGGHCSCSKRLRRFR
jgi:hypothetical protein